MKHNWIVKKEVKAQEAYDAICDGEWVRNLQWGSQYFPVRKDKDSPSGFRDSEGEISSINFRPHDTYEICQLIKASPEKPVEGTPADEPTGIFKDKVLNMGWKVITMMRHEDFTAEESKKLLKILNGALQYQIEKHHGERKEEA